MLQPTVKTCGRNINLQMGKNRISQIYKNSKHQDSKRFTGGEEFQVFPGRSQPVDFWASYSEWQISTKVLSIYTALRVPLKTFAIPRRPLRVPSGDIKSLLLSSSIVETLGFFWCYLWNITRIWLAEILVVDVWRCREMRPVPKDRLFQMLLPSLLILEILRFPWGYFWRPSESACLWLAEIFDVDVLWRREMRPVPKDRPFQMPLGDTKSLPESSFTGEILKFEWGPSWGFFGVKNPV